MNRRVAEQIFSAGWGERGKGTSLNSDSLAPKPLASSVYVRVPEARCPHKRSISVMSLFPSFRLLEPDRITAADCATPQHRGIDTDVHPVVLGRRTQDARILGQISLRQGRHDAARARVPPGTWETLSFPSSQAAGDTAYQLQIDPRLRVRGRGGRTTDATMVSPSEGNEARRNGRQGVAAPHSTVEAGEPTRGTPVKGRGCRLMSR